MRTGFYWLIIAVCLSFQTKLMAKSLAFDPALSEFVLKNAVALKGQIKHQTGVGYSSLANQLARQGCKPSLLANPTLTEQKNSYGFYTQLMDQVRDCDLAPEGPQEGELAQFLQGKTPYLLIAGESLEAPMSYFGHSLLLFLDEEDFYFSPVLSVLAPLESKQVFSQTLKGGFSHIRAEINLTPLHQVIAFYNNFESRSLRFIKLPPDQFDPNKLIDYFDQALAEPLTYNFFLENCATYIYRALDQACDCLNQDKTLISPALMEAQVFQAIGQNEVFELPSLLNQFHQQYDALNDFEQKAVQQMVLDSGFQYQGMHQGIGDAAVLASRLSFETYKTPYPSYFGLLETYGNGDGLLSQEPQEQAVSDEEKDRLNLSSVSLVLEEDEISSRLALVDYSQFYQRQVGVYGASLEAGTLTLSDIDESARIEDITLLGIRTLKPLNFVSKALSWQVKLGAERRDEGALRPMLRYGLGPTVSIFGGNFYVLPSLEISRTTRVPVYSGVEWQGGWASIGYENKDLESHHLRVFKRLNSGFALSYQAQKEEKEELEHSASLFYFF